MRLPSWRQLGYLIILTLVLGSAPAAAQTLSPLRDFFGDSPIEDPTRAAGLPELARQALSAFDGGEWRRAARAHEALIERFPGNASYWERLAYASYNAKRYERAAEAYERALLLGTTFPTYSLYNWACCEALAQNPETAMSLLKRSLEAGFENRNAIRDDTDLETLHEHPDWPEVTGLLPSDVTGRDAG